jgi:hypothetical protein
LAVSIITHVGASAGLARTLLKVANMIKSTKYEAQLTAADISVFSCSLTQLSTVVEIAHPETDRLCGITAVLLTACKTLIQDLTELIGDPLSYKTNHHRAFVIQNLQIRFK